MDTFYTSKNENTLANHTTEAEHLRQRVAVLEQQVDLYTTLIEQLPIGLHVYQLEDPDDNRTLRMVMANAASEALTGAKTEQIIGKTLDENFPALREQGIPQAYARVIRSGQPLVTQVTYGDERVRESTYAVEARPFGTEHVMITFTNVTENVERERELRLFKALVENAPDGIGVTDMQANIVYANPAYQEMTGYGDALIGMNTLSIVAETELPMVHETLQKLPAQGFANVQTVYRHKDGSSLPVDVNIVLIENDAGQTHIIGSIRDITERRQAEAELQRLAAVVETSADFIGLASLDGRALYVNDAGKRLVGLASDAAVQQTQVIDYLAPEEQAQVLEEILRTVMHDGHWKGERLFRNFVSGELIPVEWNVVLIRDQTTGVPTSIATVTRDLREQKRQEAKHATLQQQVIEAQNHALRELSTPLIPITDTTVVMPLVGTIDSARAQQVLETLLNGVSQHQAKLAILDITGVQVVDTQVADALIRAARAVGLLGAQAMLTGIQPQIAQTLVHLGVDLSGIITRSTLQVGVADALNSTRAKAPLD